MVESFVVLYALGGGCLEDFSHFRGMEVWDAGARDTFSGAALHFSTSFMRCRDGGAAATGSGQIAFIPGRMTRWSTPSLSGTGAGAASCSPELGIATVDLVASFIESRIELALRSYLGERRSQPLLAVSSEMVVVVSVAFLFLYLPALFSPLSLSYLSFSSFPHSLHTYYFLSYSSFLFIFLFSSLLFRSYPIYRIYSFFSPFFLSLSTRCTSLSFLCPISVRILRLASLLIDPFFLLYFLFTFLLFFSLTLSAVSPFLLSLPFPSLIIFFLPHLFYTFFPLSPVGMEARSFVSVSPLDLFFLFIRLSC